MAKRWSDEENEVCIDYLPFYRNYMSHVVEGKVKHGEHFAQAMLDTYPGLWPERNKSSLSQHMGYLNDVTAGTKEPDGQNDQKYFRIFLEGAETVGSFLCKDIPEELGEGPDKLVEENDNLETHNLLDDEIEVLQAFVGYGDRNKSKILFFGNEEGLGGYELTNVIKARCEVFGKHKETYFNGNDWRDGFYEIPENVDEHYNEVMRKLRGSLKSQSTLSSPMLEFQARIVLHQLEPEKDWFLKQEDNPENYKRIKDYYQTSLYKRDSKFNISLMDLRPFPRRKQSEWPYKNLDRLQYIKAVDFVLTTNLDDYYKELRDKRAKILRNAIEISNANILVGIGAKDAKRRFFEQYFESVHFQELSLTKDKIELYKATIQLENKTLTVLLSDFFDNINNIGLAGLEKLTKDHIQL